jgi:hypothetical protein
MRDQGADLIELKVSDQELRTDPNETFKRIDVVKQTVFNKLN